LKFNGLHGVISQKMVLFLTTAVRTSNPLFIFYRPISLRSPDISVGIETGYGIDDHEIGVRFPAEAINFSLLHNIQNAPEAHPVSYLLGTESCLLGGKAARA
jgi:hypothetical protein